MARVQINYKSGITMVINVDAFGVKRQQGSGFEAEWTNADPRPLLLGIDEVESIWEL